MNVLCNMSHKVCYVKCLIVGSACHKNTNAKVERANGVIGDTLQAYANSSKDDWDKQLPLAEFAVNSTASTLGRRRTFASSSIAPCIPACSCWHHSDHAAHESPSQYTQRMRSIEATVLELLATTKAASKAKLDTRRVDTVFKVGDRVLLRTKELLDAAGVGKLRPLWGGPFTVMACPSPNASTHTTSFNTKG